jgi:hypothetical protein
MSVSPSKLDWSRPETSNLSKKSMHCGSELPLKMAECDSRGMREDEPSKGLTNVRGPDQEGGPAGEIRLGGK